MRAEVCILFLAPLLVSCEELDDDGIVGVETAGISKRNMALVLSSVPLEQSHYEEVHDAVSRSGCN